MYVFLAQTYKIEVNILKLNFQNLTL